MGGGVLRAELHLEVVLAPWGANSIAPQGRQSLLHFELRVLLAGAVLRTDEDRVDVAGVDERRTGQHRQATTEDVLVGQVQPQGVDSLVALQVRLLINREPDGAVLDVCLATSAFRSKVTTLALLPPSVDGLHGGQARSERPG